MNSENLYAERKIMAMGNYYMRHVDRMTREGLRAKSDIAAELGFRDMEIDRLRARVAELEAIRRLVLFETSEDADGYMPHHPREALFVLRSAANSTAPPAPTVDVDAISDEAIKRGRDNG